MRRFFTLTVLALTLCGLAASPAIAQRGGGDDEPVLDEPPDRAPKKLKGYEKTINLAVDDIREYWADEFSVLYADLPYEEVSDDEIFAMTPDTDEGPSCGSTSLSYDEVANNAQYARCNSGEKFIWWDDEELFPQFYADYGDYSIALVLAHEWGHAIQDQAGNLGNPSLTSQLVELQADCFAGAWTQRVQNGDSTIELKGGELDQGLSALLQVADPVGTDPEADGAHGNAFDRVNAFQNGLEDGAEGCVTYFSDPPLTTEITFTSEQDAATGGNVDADLVLPITVDLLNDFYSQVEPDVYQELTVDDVVTYDSSAKKSKLPKCGGTTPPRKALKSRVFYCLDDGYIGFDQPYLQTVYDTIGDFGVATLFANAWATYVQTLQEFPGVEDNADNAVLGADCYTGGFAAAMYNELLSSDELSTDGQPEAIIFSPGDLDETIQAFINYNKARGVEANLDVTFLRVSTFRDGFLQGFESCTKWQEESSLDQPSG